MAPKKVMKAMRVKSKTLMKEPKPKSESASSKKVPGKGKGALMKGNKTQLTKSQLDKLGKLSLKEKLNMPQQVLTPQKKQHRTWKTSSSAMKGARFGPSIKLLWKVRRKHRESMMPSTRPRRGWLLCFVLLKTRARSFSTALQPLDPSTPWWKVTLGRQKS